jgi:hypothetical protein
VTEPAREKELSGQGVHEEEASTEVYVLMGQAKHNDTDVKGGK